MAIERRTPTAIDAAPGFYPFGAHVGGDDALDTSDAGATYVEVFTRHLYQDVTMHTFQWEPAGPIPADATVTIEADWTTDSGAFSVAFNGFTIATFLPPGVDNPVFGEVTTRPVASGWVEDGAPFLPGATWEIYPLDTAVFFGTSTTLITRLTLVIETAGVEPLRLRQRGDGLGLGAPRVRQAGSRQLSPRVRGYL